MGERLVAWKSKPSESVVQTIRSLARKTIMLVQRPGPTCFVLQEAGSEVKTKVLVGSRVTCSTCKASQDNVCIHTLFVMLKVLGVPPSNPLVWQGSLLDRELEELIQCGNRLGQKPKPKGGKGQPDADALKRKGNGVQPRKIDPDERCPICFDPLAEAREQELLSCESCGNHIHGRCIYVWARHQESVDRKVTCPLCRGDWGEVKWSREYACDKRGKPVEQTARDRNKDTHYGSSCGKCSKAPLQGKRFTCVICRHFDLCEECFEAGAHAVHPFVVQNEPGSEPEFAPRGDSELENFEFKASTSSSSSGTSKTNRGKATRPFKERTSVECNEGNLQQQQTPVQRRTPQRAASAGKTQDLGGDPLSLSLMAVGTSVKSGTGENTGGGRSTFPCSHASVMRSASTSATARRRLSRSMTRSKTLDRKSRAQDHLDGGLQPSGLDPFGGTGLSLGIQKLTAKASVAR
ncbi:hypothetical protein HOP50_03g20010 [Chloropicon primus]|nr:hypothetical protein HOP50_03g20010 [Chloropicon primus]